MVKCLPEFEYFTVFLKNKNIIFKIRRSKVTDYAALNIHCLFVCFQLAYRVASSLSDIVVETHRRKHLAYLMADQGAIVNPESAKNLPKQVSHSSCYCYC